MTSGFSRLVYDILHGVTDPSPFSSPKFTFDFPTFCAPSALQTTPRYKYKHDHDHCKLFDIMTQTRSGNANAGDKHKLDDTASSGSPPAKVQKKDDKLENGDDKKKQTTIEESLNGLVI